MSNVKLQNKIKQSVLKSIPLTITTYKLPHQTEEQISEILVQYLIELGQEELKDNMIYCLKELAVNAKKANTKRVYFEEKKLNLLNREDYQKGMTSFKKETLDNHVYWLELQERHGLFIKFIFHPVGRNFKISIKNNVEITRNEQMRIYDRIARSRAFDSLDEAFSEVLDDSEGAGLGIVILVLMLRKMGLDEDAFEIDGDNGTTTASITVPIHEVKLESLDVLTEQIANEIQQLPPFPENIVAMQKLIDDPDAEFADIARRISTDPTLTAALLRAVNSAEFMLPNRVDNIFEAVKMIGLRGVKNLFYNYGAETTLGLPAHPDIWVHSHKVAFYSYTFARQLTQNKSHINDAYVGGVLHDMGKIVFSSLHPDMLDKIRKFSSERNISPELFENFSAGYNHAEIGAKIAEKWNFPETLIDTIRCHHEPFRCKKENRFIVFCVYLANVMCRFEEGILNYDVIDHNILGKFRIKNEDQFKSTQKKFLQAYNQEIKGKPSNRKTGNVSSPKVKAKNSGKGKARPAGA